MKVHKKRERADRETTGKEKADKEVLEKKSSDKDSSDKESLDKENSDKKNSNKDSSDKEGLDKENSDKKRADEEACSAEEPVTEENDKKEKKSETEESGGKEESRNNPPEAEAAKAKGEANSPGAEAAEAKGEANPPGAEAEGEAVTEQVPFQAFDDQDEEGEDWENDVLPDDWEEEAEPSKPWVVALVFCGMIFAAAAICVQAWAFTHSDKKNGEDRDVFAGNVEGSGDADDLSPGQALSDAEKTPTGNQDGNTVAGTASGETETPAPVSEQNRVTTQEGRVVIFTECDDIITPKEYVNLRTEPSTSQGEATVGCQLNHGETAHRTGISDMGWSRVEYNDQVLYVVTSYVNEVTDGQPAE